MRIKNISPDLYWRNWFSITSRDLMVVMCCLLWEHTSLKAYWFLLKNLKRTLAKRRAIQASQRVDNQYVASWFQYAPVSKQAPKKMVRMLSRSETART
jgi:DNA segregation ATPase FtsK/SpoIIIE-like protein